MDRLASEYDPETGKFHFTIDDSIQAEIAPDQYMEFISQSVSLVNFVVEKYFGGSMSKFVASYAPAKKASRKRLPKDSKKIAEEVDKWIREQSSQVDFGA